MGNADKLFKVDILDLHAAATKITGGAADAVDEFSRHHSSLDEAASGLFATSQFALRAKVDSWRSAANALTSQADGHGANMHSSGYEYETAEAANVALVESVSSPQLDLSDRT